MLGASFEGLSSDFALEPPDPHGAAGPSGILQAINVRLAYYAKNGALRWTSHFSTLFSGSGNHEFSDPRAVYDPSTGRFYVEILELDFNAFHSYIDLAVSKSSNPSSAGSSDWYTYRMENTRGQGSGGYWGDYSTLGYDAQGIYVSLNTYTFPPYHNGDVQLTVINKSAALTGTAPHTFTYIPGGDNAAFTLQPCTVIGTNNPGNVIYYGETLPGGSRTNIRVWALSDPLGSRTLTNILVPVPNNGGPPPAAGAPQPSITNTIDTLDGRTQGNAFWNNGSIWFCATLGGSTGKSLVYYYRIDLHNFPNGIPTVGQSGSIDGGNGVWTYQPSIGGNDRGDVCLVFCGSASKGMYPTIFAAGQAAGATSFTAPLLIKASPTIYRGTRWGDYGSVSVDPSDNSFWVTHEWSKTSQVIAWSTWWGNVRVGNAPSITLQPAGQNVPLGSRATLGTAASGTSPLVFQWRKDGSNLAGATNSLLSLDQVWFTDSGNYSVQVSNLFGFAVSSNAAITVGSALAAWGNNDFGQCTAPALTNAVAIAAGAFHSLALRADGSILAWGNNYDGECSVPPGLTNAIGVAAGAYHSLAVLADGTVAAWGANYAGQTNVPASATNVVAVAAGDWHSLALRADGSVLAWGDDSFGQSDVPVDLVNAVAIAAGGAHSLALRSDGIVIAWGNDLNSDGLVAGQVDVPLNLGQVVAIAAGESHSLALQADGKVVGWGDNSSGQINVPAALTRAVAIAAGGGHSLALQEGGAVVAWGDGLYGQDSSDGLTANVSLIAAGAYHNLALVGQRTVSPLLFNPVWASNVFAVGVPTVAGKAYFLQYKNSMSDPAWRSPSAIVGNGSARVLSDSGAGVKNRFYRVRQQ